LPKLLLLKIEQKVPIYRRVKQELNSDEVDEKNNFQKFQAPRGTDNISVEDSKFMRYIRKIFFKLAEERGFEEVFIPAFEDVELFKRSVGEGTDIVEKEMFLLEERKEGQEKKFALRPEATAGICRKYIESGWVNLPQPVKVFFFGEVFRAERPQAGRFRQFYQLDLETLGSKSPVSDVEIIKFAWDFLEKLGLKNLRLEINSIGCPKCRPKYIENLRAHFESYEKSLSEESKARMKKNILRILDSKDEKDIRVANLAPRSTDFLCPECKEHFDSVKNSLKNSNINFEINHKLVRGLDYYTKTTFEIMPYDDFEGPKSSLAGGGRYDNLLEMIGGRSTSAVGMAMGVERIMAELKSQGIEPKFAKKRVYVAFIGKEAESESVKLSATLQSAGFKVLKPSASLGISAQFKEANKLGVEWVVMLGEHEIETNTLILKELKTGVQSVILREKVIEELVSKFQVEDDE